MTILDGEIITAADLNTLFDGYYTSLSADNGTDPGDIRIGWHGDDAVSKTISWVAGDDYQVIGFGCDGYHLTSTAISNSFTGLGVSFAYAATVSGGGWRYRAAAGDSNRIYKGADYTIVLTTAASGNNNLWVLVRAHKRKV